MLKKGTQAPEFDLVDQDGKRHTLQSLLAKGPLILYFYPADFTPGCTKEACTFRDLQHDLLRARLRVVGVSPQDADSHRKFAAKHNLNFTLLADPDKTGGQGLRRGWSTRIRGAPWHVPDWRGRQDPGLGAGRPADRGPRRVRTGGARGRRGLRRG